MDAYRLILLAAPDADLTEMRRIAQDAALPEPLIYFLNGASPASLYALAPDLVLVRYDELRRCCADWLSYLAQSPEVPIILLVRPEERAAAQPLAELPHILPFDYVQSEPYMLRQIVDFAVQQRRTQRLLEQNLQAFSDSSRLLHNLINHNADGMLVIDQEGIIRFANQSAGALFGRSVEALIGLPFGFPLVLGRTTELDLRTADGRECVVEMQLVTTEWQGQTAYLAALRDATERVLAQRRLQQRLALERLLATISAQLVSLPIGEVDERIMSALQRLAEFIGAERAALVDLCGAPTWLAITHLWEAPHIAGYYPDVDAEAIYRAAVETFTQQDWMLVRDTQALPPDDPVGRVLRGRGVRTLMGIAMRNNGVLRGCLVFSSVSETRPWQPEDAALLSIAADVFASTLRRAAINRALRESEARLRFVMNNAPLILFTFNREGVIDFLEGALVNQRYPHLRPKVGQSALEDRFIGAYLRKALQGESQRLTFELQDTSAIELYLTPLRDDAGAIIGGIAVAFDVTERERAQQAERRHAAFLKTLADASIALTRSLQVQSVLETILEYAERLVPCEGSWIVLLKGEAGEVRAARGRSAESIHRRWEAITSHLDARSRLERSQCADGIELIPDTAADPDWLPIEGTEWIRSYLSLLIELEGRTIGVISFDSATPNYFTREHAERLKALIGYAAIAIQNADLYQTIERNAKELERHVRLRTAELEIERARLRAILDAMEEGVIFFEFQEDAWRATYANPAFHRLFGTQESQIVGQTFLSLAEMIPVSEASASQREVLRALERDGAWQGVIEYPRKDGSAFAAHVSVTKVANLRSKHIGTVALIRDISKEKALQEQKDRFIANAAHELRTPLTNLKMRLYLLRRQPEAAQTHLAVIEQVTRRIQLLVEDLLDVTRFERGMIALKREPLRLDELLASILEVQRPHFEEKGVRLLSDLLAIAVPALADPERLTQVFTNLLVNALNYTETGGTVCLSLRCEGAEAVAEVQDSGVGIDAKSLKHIFEPFFRANLGTQRGTGLGLTIAREIVEAHGGSIAAQSEVGVGTRMIVRLPLAQ